MSVHNIRPESFPQPPGIVSRIAVLCFNRKDYSGSSSANGYSEPLFTKVSLKVLTRLLPLCFSYVTAKQPKAPATVLTAVTAAPSLDTSLCAPSSVTVNSVKAFPLIGKQDSRGCRKSRGPEGNTDSELRVPIPESVMRMHGVYRIAFEWSRKRANGAKRIPCNGYNIAGVVKSIQQRKRLTGWMLVLPRTSHPVGA
ncbi:hypothetical protein CBL_04167 [Carabus blaptoides fortunei]